jgi:hypothetical protein
MFLRPLTDLADLVEIDVHMGVPTKEAPKSGKTDKWPAQMSAVCQNAPAFIDHWDGEEESGTAVYEEGYGHCYICENMTGVLGKFKKPVSKTSSQVWGLFVVRRALNKNGSPISKGERIERFADETEDVKGPDGKLHPVPKIVIASQSWSNFWGAFSASAYMSGTICDADYLVKREDNDYHIVRSPETPDHKPGTASWERYAEAIEAKDISIENTLVEQSSPAYYGRFFDPSWVDKDDDGADAGSSAGADEGEISPEAAAEMSDKMKSAFSTKPS